MASTPNELPRFTLETTPKGMWAVRDHHENARVYIIPRRDYAEKRLAELTAAWAARNARVSA
jgi:hypothetical protein